MNDDTARNLAAWLTVEHARLDGARFGSQCYLAPDVDAFIADATAQLDRGELPRPAWVRGAKFRTSKDFRKGYGLRSVDALLDALEERLRAAHGEPAPAPDTAAMIELVKNVRFTTTLGRGGYAMQEVDDYLDQVVQALTQGREPGPAPAFTTVRRRGYDKQEVDAFSAQLRAQ